MNRRPSDRQDENTALSIAANDPEKTDFTNENAQPA